MKKLRSNKGNAFIKLILSAVFVFFCIYVWKLLDCSEFPKCNPCGQFSSKFLFNSSLVSSSTTNDFSRMMNLTNFSFLMNNLVCNDTKEILLVLVCSSPTNFEKRLTIRTTWGNITGENFKLLFLLGMPNNSIIQGRLEEENKKNKDIVQGNFMDVYRNLTYKHIMALKWTKYFCPEAKYMLKADDDIFVNSPTFLKYLHQGLVPETEVIHCLLSDDNRAHRTFRSKWRVTISEYKYSRYPPFCLGAAILYSPDVVQALYDKAQISNYFWIDDVFVTGLLASTTNYTHKNFGKLILKTKDSLKYKNSDICTYLLGPFNLRVDEIKTLWNKVLKADCVSFKEVTS